MFGINSVDSGSEKQRTLSPRKYTFLLHFVFSSELLFAVLEKKHSFLPYDIGLTLLYLLKD
jgi:hypothetical protein